MREILLITSITLREALRRKVWLWVLIILGGMALMDFMIPHAIQGNMRMQAFNEAEKTRQGILMAQHIGTRIAIFFSCIIAIVLAAGQISTEIERGVLATILPKPLARWQVLVGKWIGVVVFPCFCILFSLTANWLICSAIYGFGSGYKVDVPALGVMMLYPMLYATVTLAFSSFSSMVLALLMTCTLYAVTMVGDMIIKVIARITESKQLENLQVLSTWIIPHDRLSRWLGRSEESFLTAVSRQMTGGLEAVTAFDQFYVCAYIVGFFLLSLLVFSKRDIS